MAKYVIPWSVSGEFDCQADSYAAAKAIFQMGWDAGAIQPRRDGTLWARPPIEVISRDDPEFFSDRPAPAPAAGEEK